MVLPYRRRYRHLRHGRGGQGYEDDELKGATEAYRKVVSQDDIKANVTILTDAKAIPPEQKEFIGDQWAENINYVGVDRCAFVSDGTIGLTIKANVLEKVDHAEVENFKEFEDAKEWAEDA
ncbi:MAG: hypothetical protein ABEK04_01180 [Candidatus Nanohalobium sp.]